MFVVPSSRFSSSCGCVGSNASFRTMKGRLEARGINNIRKACGQTSLNPITNPSVSEQIPLVNILILLIVHTLFYFLFSVFFTQRLILSQYVKISGSLA